MPSFALSISATFRFANFPRHQYLFTAQQLDTSLLPWSALFLIDTSTQQGQPNSIPRPSPLMTPRSSSSAPPRLNRHQERSLSLQLVPRSIPTRPQPPTAHSSHYRSPSPSRFPRFEETSVSEKSRCDGVFQTSPAKAEASTSWDDAPGSLSSHHQSRPASASSLRHLTHQNSACPDYPLSPIPDTASAQFAMPLPSLHSGYLHPPRKIRLWSIVKPWLPVLAYVSTSLGFVIAIAFWKTQVFEGALYYPMSPPALCAISVHSFQVNCEYRPLTFIRLHPQLWTTCLAGSRPTKFLVTAFSFSSSS